MRSLRGLLCAVLLAPASPLCADPQAAASADVARYDRGFSSVQQATHSYRADITQTLRLEGLTRPITSIGTIYYANPDKLLVRFSRPAGEWMLVNGSQAALQKAGKPIERRDLATQGRTASHAASLLDFFHADPTRWHHDFDVSMARDGDKLFVHLKPWMTPTATSQGVEQIVTTLLLPRYDIVGMTITINAGNSVDYQFSHGERNAALDPALFRIPPP